MRYFRHYATFTCVNPDCGLEWEDKLSEDIFNTQYDMTGAAFEDETPQCEDCGSMTTGVVYSDEDLEYASGHHDGIIEGKWEQELGR